MTISTTERSPPSPLLRFIADTLLDGSLSVVPTAPANADSINAVPASSAAAGPAMVYEQQVALGSLLAIVRANPHLWQVVIQTVRHHESQNTRTPFTDTPKV